MLIGFVFAIPKPSTAGAAQNAAESGEHQSATSDVNTNLGQISDWLTKTIVGIGLVELRRIPTWLDRLAHRMAAGFSSVQNGESLVFAILVYFGVVGFMNGFNFTRVYMAPIFRGADLARPGAPQALALLAGAEGRR